MPADPLPPDGFTPAYAGKIGHEEAPATDWRVHPRIRGEDATAGQLRGLQQGSPPHTRGRFIVLSTDITAAGFTPAYAGKIKFPAVRRPCRRVHPRIRGEDHV